MDPTSQGAGEQQGRQQPVYDIRNGGHYGKMRNPYPACFLRALIHNFRCERRGTLLLVLRFLPQSLLTFNCLAFSARICTSG